MSSLTPISWKDSVAQSSSAYYALLTTYSYRRDDVVPSHTSVSRLVERWLSLAEMSDHPFLPTLFKSRSMKEQTDQTPDPTSILSGIGSRDKHEKYSIEIEASKLVILSKFIDLYPDAVLLLSGVGDVLAVNTAFSHRFSLLNSSTIHSLSILKLIHERDKVEVAWNIQKAFDLKLTTTSSHVLFYHVEDMDTQFRPADVSIQFNCNDEDFIMAIIRYSLMFIQPPIV